MDASGRIEFGAALRRYRLDAALSQEELAARAGLSARGISDLERGARRAPRMATVQLLIDALGLRGPDRAALLTAARATDQAPDRFGPEPPPVWPHRLIGREREIAEIVALLRNDEARLVTLTGPGGIGKTHLALAVAAEEAARFADGVAFVDLAPVRDPALVADVVARAVGLRDRGDRPLVAQLRAHLAERSMLVVVDNCEHLAPAMPMLAELLRSCPRLKALATSRDRLRLRGERQVAIGPLALLPTGESAPSMERLAEIASIRLFVERAAATRSGFALTPDNAASIAELCRRLDGWPLAIELAATQIKTLPPATLLDRLERRLPALVGARDLPDRQRTLSATIAWSYDLLSPDEQALFRRLAAFAGPFSLEAAEWIAADGAAASDEFAASQPTIERLAALLDQNLIRRDVGADDDPAAPRFTMLDTIRRFAADRLEASGDAPFVRDRNAAYLLALAERAAPELFGPREREWLAALERERDNIRAALEWAAASGDRTTLMRLVAALWRYWYALGHHSEGRAFLRAAMADSDQTPTPERARALTGAALLEHCGGDDARAIALGKAGLADAQLLGDDADAAIAHFILGKIAEDAGRYDDAEAQFDQAIAGFRQADDAAWIGLSLDHLGSIAFGRGENERAVALLTDALRRHQAIGHGYGAAVSLLYLGHLANAAGDPVGAETRLTESLIRWRDESFWPGIAEAIAGLATAARMREQPERAARLFGAADAVRRRVGLAASLPERALYEREIAAARQGLGEDAFTWAWTAGQALPTDEAIEEALEPVTTS